MSTETLLALGYGSFLLLAAGMLDLLARHSHRRSERYRTAGFRFYAHLDHWECPEGELLHRVDTDHLRRVARYRARAEVCNACPAKQACTDSSEGREIAQALDPWPHSEAGRFHRGICVMLAALAAGICLVALLRADQSLDAAALAGGLALALLATVRMLADLRHTPAGFQA